MNRTDSCLDNQHDKRGWLGYKDGVGFPWHSVSIDDVGDLRISAGQNHYFVYCDNFCSHDDCGFYVSVFHVGTFFHEVDNHYRCASCQLRRMHCRQNFH